VQAQIAVNGSGVDQASLHDWLMREKALRGYVGPQYRQPPVGAMGVPADMMVQVAATAAGATAVWAALAKSLTVWLTQRRSDVEITVNGPDGRTVTVNAKRIPDPETLTRMVLDVAAESPDTPG